MSITAHATHFHPSRARTQFECLLDPCGIRINGNRSWDIRVLNEDFYARVLHEGSLGFGESYMDAWWEVDDLEELTYRLLKARVDERALTWRDLVAFLTGAIFNRQLRSRAFIVGEQHYDIGNDLYECMLDPLMIYSCGYWESAQTLEGAQRAKLDLVFRKLGLKPHQRVLDVGCGWGGALQYAAQEYDAQGIGITISHEQANHARQRCDGLPITIRLEDYRALAGEFDHVYSIGMFEHVGPKNYRTYMRTLRDCLRPDGLFLLHTIGANHVISRASHDQWIEKYIFPNARLPTRGQIESAIAGLFTVTGWQCIGSHYVRTLRAWKSNFERHWPTLRRNRDERFFRMWQLYLSSSAATFRAGKNDVWQFLLAPM